MFGIEFWTCDACILYKASVIYYNYHKLGNIEKNDTIFSRVGSDQWRKQKVKLKISTSDIQLTYWNCIILALHKIICIRKLHTKFLMLATLSMHAFEFSSVDRKKKRHTFCSSEKFPMKYFLVNLPVLTCDKSNNLLANTLLEISITLEN